MKNYILLAGIIVLYTSCQFNTPSESKSKPEADIVLETTSGHQQGIAKEVLQTSNYTYILLAVDGVETWVAGPRMEAAVGEKYFYVQNMEMENFKSKELNRTFESVIFAQSISKDENSFNEKPQSETGHQSDVKITRQDIKIEPTKGVTSIADLFANKNKLAGTTITIKGVVTKYNAEIMGKNWIHLQDGTEKDGNFDLVITTLVNAKLGEIITLTGKVVLDKDFGYGYKYDVLIEDAVKKATI